MEIKDLEQILELLKRNDITDFELIKEGIQLKLSRAKPDPKVMPAYAGPVHNYGIEPAFAHSVHSLPVPHTNVPLNSASAVANDSYFKVESPLVGTFYRKASPDADNFVVEGNSVKKGDTLCIVEAMKLMNEIDAPVSGTIEKILVGDGDVVEFGEVMFLIKPSA